MKARSVGLSLGLAILTWPAECPRAGPWARGLDRPAHQRDAAAQPGPALDQAEPDRGSGVPGSSSTASGSSPSPTWCTYAEEIYVQPGQGGDRVEAKVAAIAPGIDLAVLTIDPAEGDFFDKRPPLPRATALPQVPSRVAVKGFPIGGNSLSTTQGIVSRIEYAYFDTGSIGPAHPGRRGDQPGQQRRPGPGQRQDGRPGLGPGGGRERRLSHRQRGGQRLPRGHRRRPVRRQAVARPSSGRRSRTRRCGPSSGWPRPCAGSWSASRGTATRPTRSRSSTSSPRSATRRSITRG